jgi:hypothetical protein
LAPDPEPGRYAVYRGSTLLGTSHLEWTVEPGARVAGRLDVTPAFGSIVAVFNLYRQAATLGDARLLKEYVRDRDALRLEVWDSGHRLDAQVELISTWGPHHRMIHVHSRDERLWQGRGRR